LPHWSTDLEVQIYQFSKFIDGSSVNSVETVFTALVSRNCCFKKRYTVHSTHRVTGLRLILLDIQAKPIINPVTKRIQTKI